MGSHYSIITLIYTNFNSFGGKKSATLASVNAPEEATFETREKGWKITDQKKNKKKEVNRAFSVGIPPGARPKYRTFGAWKHGHQFFSKSRVGADMKGED